MKRAIIRLISALLFILVLMGYTHADEIAYWKRVLTDNNLVRIAELMNKSEAVQWPKIHSLKYIETLTTDEQGKQKGLYELSQRLFEVIREFEAINQKEYSVAELTNMINIYSKLDRALRSSGGYVNYVLADSVQRLSLSHLCSFLVHNLQSHKKIEELFDKFNFPTFEASVFASLIEEEAGIVDAHKKLEGISEYDMQNAIFKMCKIDNARSMLFEASGTKKINTSNLMRLGNIPILFWRVGETNRLARINLSGLIKFLELGGNVSNIDPKDMTLFKKNMGDSRQLFKFDLLHVNSLYPSDLKVLIEAFGSLTWRNAFSFYSIALD